MIDNKTQNKNYPLPHPENIARQDVARIAESIKMIDSDISNCETDVAEIVETVSELDARSIRIPASLVGEINTELQDIVPNNYIRPIAKRY